MDSGHSDSTPVSGAGAGAGAARARGIHVRGDVQAVAKLLVAGPFGVGKTTLIGSISEIEPLRTEELMTAAGATVDDLAGVAGKNTTTVSLDFGRLTLPGNLVLYLFGTPGQVRFLDMWREIAHGAYGAIVLADARRLDTSFEALTLVERLGLPHLVALNVFPKTPVYPETELRDALSLDPQIPLTSCDARDATSVHAALITLVTYLSRLSRTEAM